MTKISHNHSEQHPIGLSIFLHLFPGLVIRIQEEQVTILPGRVEMHFLVADAAGNYALLEYRNGKNSFMLNLPSNHPL